MSVIPASVEHLLADMVRLDTVNAVVSGDMMAEQKLVDYNEEVARAMGLRTQRLAVPGRPDNLLVTIARGKDRPWILFESHTDTVSVEGMTIDPFGAEVRDGRLWGRGACDTKGTGASMLWAMHQYAQSQDQPNNIAILFVVDEEYGMSGVKAFAEKQLAMLDWRPTIAIVGEPTMLQPITAHNGMVRWKVKGHGVAAHSADPSRGRSAITAICRAVEALETRYAPSLTASDPMCGKAQCSVNIIHGGIQINIIPEYCEAHVDRRVVPGEDYRTVIPAVEKVLDEVRAATPDVRLEVEVLFDCPPLLVESSRAVLPVVQGALRQLGLSAEPQGVKYGTDAARISNAGVPAIVLGPGDIAQAHTKDEWLDLEQLRRGVQAYEALMRAAW